MDIKVTKVRVTPLAIPYKEPYYWAKGVHMGADTMLVEMDTDAGITGVGEASGEHSPEAVRATIESLKQFVEERSVFDVQRFLDDSYWTGLWSEVRRFANSAIAGVEMALWDIIGKSCEQPLHRLMGGKARDRVSWFGSSSTSKSVTMAHPPQKAKRRGPSSRSGGGACQRRRKRTSHERPRPSRR